MSKPRSLAGFKRWIRTGKKLKYKNSVCKITSIRSQTFDLTDPEGNLYRLPICIGQNSWSGNSFSINGHDMEFIDG